MSSTKVEEMLLVYESLVLGDVYRKKVCFKCLGTEQQQKRACALLRGYNKPSCKHMSNAIDIKLKEKDKKIMQKIMVEATQLQEQKVSGINSELLGV